MDFTQVILNQPPAAHQASPAASARPHKDPVGGAFLNMFKAGLQNHAAQSAQGKQSAAENRAAAHQTQQAQHEQQDQQAQEVSLEADQVSEGDEVLNTDTASASETVAAPETDPEAEQAGAELDTTSETPAETTPTSTPEPIQPASLEELLFRQQLPQPPEESRVVDEAADVAVQAAGAAAADAVVQDEALDEVKVSEQKAEIRAAVTLAAEQLLAVLRTGSQGSEQPQLPTDAPPQAEKVLLAAQAEATVQSVHTVHSGQNPIAVPAQADQPKELPAAEQMAQALQDLRTLLHDLQHGGPQQKPQVQQAQSQTGEQPQAEQAASSSAEASQTQALPAQGATRAASLNHLSDLLAQAGLSIEPTAVPQTLKASQELIRALLLGEATGTQTGVPVVADEAVITVSPAPAVVADQPQGLPVQAMPETAPGLHGPGAVEQTRPSAHVADSGDRFQLVRQLSDRIQLLHNARQHSLQMTLHPADLGKLSLRLQQQGQQLHLQILTQLPLAKEMLEAHLQQLRDQLAHQGLHLQQVSINVHPDWNQSQQDPQREQGRQAHGSTRSGPVFSLNADAEADSTTEMNSESKNAIRIQDGQTVNTLA
ncbi:MAG: flagellar hook-length control protein FliK [Candidatus Sericytochromatia bacterium]